MGEERIRDMAVGAEARAVRLTNEDMLNLMMMAGTVQYNDRSKLFMFYGDRPLRFFGDENIEGLFDKFLSNMEWQKTNE